jgi:hypothetical protein
MDGEFVEKNISEIFSVLDPNDPKHKRQHKFQFRVTVKTGDKVIPVPS